MLECQDQAPQEPATSRNGCYGEVGGTAGAKKGPLVLPHLESHRPLSESVGLHGYHLVDLGHRDFAGAVCERRAILYVPITRGEFSHCRLLLALGHHSSLLHWLLTEPCNRFTCFERSMTSIAFFSYMYVYIYKIYYIDAQYMM